MHQKYKFSPSVKRLISLQDGVISRSQAVGLSMPASAVKRLIRDEQWRSVVAGIYFVGAAEPSWRAMAWAGILVGGVGAMLTGLAGAYEWGIADKAPEIIDVLVPPNKRTQKIQGPWRFERRRTLPRAHGDLPVAAPQEVILDVCDAQPEKAAYWISQACYKIRWLRPDDVSNALEARSRYKHRKLVSQIVGDYKQGIQSVLEKKYYIDVEKAHGLPKGRRQSRGRFQTDVDYGGVFVELDGRAGHVGGGRFRDMERDNYHAVMGAVTLRYGWDDVNYRPCEVAFQVNQVLGRCGIRSDAHPCPKCRT